FLLFSVLVFFSFLSLISYLSHSLSSLIPPPPRSSLFPYTTLFRSRPLRLQSHRALSECGRRARDTQSSRPGPAFGQDRRDRPVPPWNARGVPRRDRERDR